MTLRIITVFVFLLTLSVGAVAMAETITPEERARLEEELRKYQEEVDHYNELLKQQEEQTGTIQGDVNLLNSKIKRAEAAIAARNATIRKLKDEIYLKTLTIGELEEKIEREKESLAQLVRKTSELDQTPPIMALLAGESISDFYIDLDAYSTVRGAVKVSLDELAEAKKNHEQARVSLIEKQDQEQGIREELQHRKASVQQNKKEKDRLLSISKSKEEEYEELLAERRQKVAEIRARLFKFAGGRTDPIPFEEALRLAEEAAAATGVRPAFILAILEQESRLGANVGTCNLPGDPPEKKWYNIMPGPEHRKNYVANGNSCSGLPDGTPCSWRDDQSIFKELATELGFDYETVPLSCPQSVGFGGAMGPSQFIPWTWNNFKDRIGEATGNIPPNPWLARDAIFATALYVSDLGADKRTYAWERTAACRYYSGRACSTSSFIGNYGSSVMKRTESIQDDIDYLKEYGTSRR